MLGGNIPAPQGFGISTKMTDNEYPILVVDCDNQTITMEDERPDGSARAQYHASVGKR